MEGQEETTGMAHAPRCSGKEANQICRECIQEALIRLLRTKDLDQITISELVRTAGVSRTTYYRNYYNKEDVLKDLFDSLMAEVATAIAAAPDDHTAFVAFFECIQENAEVYLVLQKANYTLSELDEITRLTSANTPEDHVIDKTRLAFVAGGLFNVARIWLENGAVETPEEMAERYEEVLQDPLRERGE